MRILKYKIPIIVLSILVLANCKKTKSIESVPEVWVEYGDFSGRNKVLLNSYGDSSYLQVIGVHRLTIYNKAGNSANWSTSADYGILERPPTMPNYFIERTGTKPYSEVKIYSLPDLGRATSTFTVGEADSTCSSVDIIPSFRGESILTNNNNQMLVAYQAFNKQNEYKRKYILGTLVNGQMREVKVVQAQENKLSITGNSHGNNFYLSDISSTYRINSNGDPRKVSDVGLDRIFYLDNVLWGISTFGAIYTSTNQGEDWNRFSPNLQRDWAGLHYANVNGHVFAFHRAKVYEMTHSKLNGSSTLSLKEIDNTGLDNTEITSISYFKGHYYVTTYNGLFRKSEGNFFTFK